MSGEPLRARDQRIVPRGINREQAAAYIGISPTTFDVLVAKDLMPPARMLEGRRVWDLREIDQAFDLLPHADPANPSNSPPNKAGSAVNDWN